MNYPLYDMNDHSFEDLIAMICQIILGTGTIVFSTGKDGGRDALFTGTANKFPSESAPWKGKFVIQAKHTTNPIASCSDSEFNTILKKEKPRIEQINDDGKVDYYLLFTNRKLSGLQHPKISDFIDDNLDVENEIFGVETIQLWLKEYPQIVKNMALNKLLLPLEFYEEDIRQVIVEFSKIKDEIDADKIVAELDCIPIETKNRLNKLGSDYFNNIMKKSYSDFEKISSFLEDPKNSDYKTMYNNTVSDLQDEILIHRDNYSSFELLLNHIYKIILDHNHKPLMNSRRLIRTFLHFMYCNCDIGIKEDKDVETR